MHPLDEDSQLLARVHPQRNTWVTFAKVQYGVEMAIERDGELSLIDELADGAGAANLAQWIFFPFNIVGIVRSQASPTIHQVSAFLRNEFADMHEEFVMSPLVRADAVETFSRMQRLTKVKLKLSRQVVADLPPSDFATAAQRLQQNSGAEVLEITASVRRRNDRLTRPIRNFISRVVQHRQLDRNSTIVVLGADEEGVPLRVSFTDNRFNFQIEVPAQTDGDPAASPIFLRIRDLYQTNRRELEAAVQLDIELDLE